MFGKFEVSPAAGYTITRKLENVKNFLLKIPTICNSYQMDVKSLYKIPWNFL
jgi:hypothetical protein